ncbi:MAG: TetR/AcrR family transcriptional regulator [Leptolyngbya sp.]|nr:TetR/AcrR family transcriptional regulator [Candidatus Melainabacteria bacterium]
MMVGKPKGSRSKDYDDKRKELLVRAGRLFLKVPTEKLSLRQIAEGVGVTIPTLNHYFGGREGIITAFLEHTWQSAQYHLNEAAQPTGELADCIRSKLTNVVDAMLNYELEKLHIFGMTEGLGNKILGPAYLNFFLEPTLQACEKWLKYYQLDGSVDADVELRFAAVALYSPLLILLMHQNQLGGSAVREASIDQFIEQHSKNFLKYLGK